MGAYDAIVVGLGAMGSATAGELAARGRRVLGLDRYAPPHAHGSSHGRTRIIREAYFEHPVYVPLVQRAYQRWAELERESGRTLLRRTGALVLGTRDGAVLAGARLSARTHAIAHEELSGAEVRRRWPAITSPEGTLGLFEVGGGLLAVEDCVDAALQRARRHGADLRFDEPVLEWEADGSGVSVGTARGRYAGGTLVLSAGPWAAGLLQGLALPLAVERQVAFWFEAAREAESLGADRCPIVLWEPAPSQLFYTIPDVGDGLKAAVHHQGDATEPDRVRPVDATDEAAVRALLARLLPAANGRVRNAVTCLYTNTPDENFIVDRHPEHPQVMVVSPCSGHGFKFSSAIGEIVADLLTEGSRRFDLTPFRLSRLMSSPR